MAEQPTTPTWNCKCPSGRNEWTIHTPRCPYCRQPRPEPTAASVFRSASGLLGGRCANCGRPFASHSLTQECPSSEGVRDEAPVLDRSHAAAPVRPFDAVEAAQGRDVRMATEQELETIVAQARAAIETIERHADGLLIYLALLDLRRSMEGLDSLDLPHPGGSA